MSGNPLSNTPSYRLHKPSGQAVVTLDGRDLYLGKHDTPASRAEFERVLGEWMANGRRLPTANRGPSDLIVNELILAYWEFALGYYRKDGESTDEIHGLRAAMRPLKRLYGRHSTSEFGPLALKNVRQAMIESDHSRKYINDNINRIKRMFKWAVENELVAWGTYHGLQAVSGLRRGRSKARETAPVLPVPEQHVLDILPHVSHAVAAMIELQMLTGMRPGEVTGMRALDLNTADAIWIFAPCTHKTEHFGRQREIYIGPKAQMILRPFLRAGLSRYLFSPAEAESLRSIHRRENRRSPMTPSQARRRRKRCPARNPGDCYSPDSYRRAIVRACECNGIPRWHPHQLRHNVATFLRKKYGIEAARVILGHSSAAVTEVYAELDRARAAQIMGEVG